MLKKNKWKIIVSSVVTLLPILFGVMMWNKLPDTMTTHWGADGVADGFSGKAFCVFGVPAIFLALQLLCILGTLLDKKQQAQNPKAIGMIFWIMPAICLFVNGIMYRAAFGLSFNIAVFVSLVLSALFLFMGNYLPKIRQNRTLGIKISWTLNNEENWNKTHRLGGKVWFICGFVMLGAVLLPMKAMLWVMGGVIVAAMAIPVAYSYSVYRKHCREGIDYKAAPQSKAEKIAFKVTAVIVLLILVGVLVLMFTGNITVACGEDHFSVEATYWENIRVDYGQIDSVQYREDLSLGMRTNGFGSARLSLGIFENEEFGPYTLYAYTSAEEYVVLTSGEKTLVIGLQDPADTGALYETLLEKIN